MYTSLALDSSDNPHISYYDNTNYDLKYAWYDGTWHTETVDSTGGVGRYTSLALDSSDNPHISYYDSTNDDLKYASPCTSSSDIDCDGVLNDVDNCPSNYNPNQEDTDGDNIGNPCDPCPNDHDNDIDLDSICGDIDNCPSNYNPNQEDVDGDGVGDVCDDCVDTDGDGYGNPGFPNTCPLDNCPTIPNPNQEDADGNGVGDVCDEGSWVKETVDSEGDVGYSTSIALDSEQKAHISYSNGEIKYATNESGSWVVENGG